jgi:hypothetical protein
MTVTIKSSSLWRFVWCMIFHGRHRVIAGEPRIMRIAIGYELVCQKCGIEDERLDMQLDEYREADGDREIYLKLLVEHGVITQAQADAAPRYD